MFGRAGQRDPAFCYVGRGFFMLDQLRQGAQGWVSKLLMALLVLSFAIWGIGGFQGYRADTLASVGNVDVSVQDFARVFANAQRAAQNAGQQVSPGNVLSSVLLAAAMDDAAGQYGLGVSDDRVAAEIAKNPLFKNADGNFDRDRFLNILANAGMNRHDFVDDTKRQLVRSQIAQSLGVGLTLPQPLVAALYRLRNEERTVSSFTVDKTAIAPVAAPGEADLQAFFDEGKESFRAPEYRKLALLTLDPAAIADPSSVAPEEIAAEYERRKPALTQPERRRVEELRFDTAEAANAALQKIEAGEDFAAVGQANGVEVTDLGIKTKAEMLDPAIAEAAFAAELNKPLAVTEGALQPSVIRVTSIEPGTVPTLEEMTEKLRGDLATRAAREHVQDLYDQVEDERAGGSTLEEAAAKLKLPYRVIDAVSVDLKAPDGSAISDIPSGAALVKEAFESDIGVENSAIRADAETFVFYEVLEITPARDRILDEVRNEVVTAWTEAETKKRIEELADKLFERLKGGADLSALAAEIGKTVQVAENVKRDGPGAGLSPNAVSQAFAGPEGHVANVEGPGDDRILLKVDKVTAPAFFAEATDATAIKSQLSEALTKDLLSTYNQQLLAARAISVNDAAYRQLTGQVQTQ
jgi:peptidyl-prolyl cis-trans isomerase D